MGASSSRRDSKLQSANEARTQFLIQSEDTGTEVELTQPSLDRGISLGRYIVLDRIGEGGMGVVYLAYDPEIDRKVAVKLIRAISSSNDTDQRSQDFSMRSRLHREAQALAKLSHPNFVAIHDVGTYYDSMFIAMAYIEGMNWRHWNKSKQRTWKESLAIALSSGRGLAAAHDAGLIHRDFKPDNVLVDPNGKAYIVDFDLAFSEHIKSGKKGNAVPSLIHRDTSDCHSTLLATKHPTSSTFIGEVMGTPAYMAPEQFQGITDARTDQFSFYVSLFESLFRRRPFSGKSTEERMNSIVLGPNEKAGDPKIPARLRQILRRGLSPNPADRFPSMHALLIELERNPWVQRRRFLVGLASMTIVVAGAVAYHHLSTAAHRQCISRAQVISQP